METPRSEDKPIPKMPPALKRIQHQPYAKNFDWILYYRILGFLLLVSVDLDWTELYNF